MNRLFVLLALLTLHPATNAQLNGIIVLKRNNTTLQRYFEGKSIEFINSYDQPISGLITKVVKDTLYLRFLDIRQGVNYWGLPTMDTLKEVPLAYAFSDIKTVIVHRTHLNYVADGVVLIAAGVALLVVSAVNTAYFKEPIRDVASAGDLIGAGALAALGAWLITLQTKHYHLGGRFHLDYIGFTK